MSLPVVLASYFNYTLDPNRKTRWDSNFFKLLPLIGSVVQHQVPIKIFHDCFENLPELPHCEWIRIDPDDSYVPTVLRWFIYKDYLSSHSEFEKVFMVDSTDVEMLCNPFDRMNQQTLYVGDEWNKTVDHPWLRNRSKIVAVPEDYYQIIDKYKDNTLLNAGLVGGERTVVLNFLEQLTQEHEQLSQQSSESSDMPILNYVVWKYFETILEHGPHINTRFKKNERTNKSWWRHK